MSGKPQQISCEQQFEEVRDSMKKMESSVANSERANCKQLARIYTADNEIFRKTCQSNNITAYKLMLHVRDFIPSILEIPSTEQLEFIYEEAVKRKKKIKLGLALVKEINELSDTSE